MLRLSYKSCLMILFGSVILAFGLYNIHSLSGVTEGGVLGLTLLFYNWFDISPSLSGAIINILCFLLGWKVLGKELLSYSFISAVVFSLFYKVFEQFDPLWPELANKPLLASILGGIFVGIGAGICIRYGGASGGDDALAMSIVHITNIKIQWVYLISDVIILLLSVSYIPINKLIYSLLTVILSGQLIGLIQNINIQILCNEVHKS